MENTPNKKKPNVKHVVLIGLMLLFLLLPFLIAPFVAWIKDISYWSAVLGSYGRLILLIFVLIALAFIAYRDEK